MEHNAAARTPGGLNAVLLGPGAIGGTIAACAARAGHHIGVVARGATAVAIRDCGLRVSGALGAFTAPVPVYATPEDAPGPYDICLIASKAYDLPALAQRILPKLKPDAAVLALQNGVCLPALAQAVGEERAVGCVITYAATQTAPGEYEITGPGGFIIGRPRPRDNDARLLQAQEILSALGPCAISDRIMAELFSKLVVNSAVTSLGALSGLLLGEEMRLAQARRVFLTLAREALAVAGAMELTVPPFGNKLDYYRLLAGENVAGDLRRHLTVYLMGRKFKRLKSSSLQSLQRGGRTEIDYLNGYLVAEAARHHLELPCNSRIIDMIKEIEAGLRPIAPENLYDAQLTAALWR